MRGVDDFQHSRPFERLTLALVVAAAVAPR